MTKYKKSEIKNDICGTCGKEITALHDVFDMGYLIDGNFYHNNKCYEEEMEIIKEKPGLHVIECGVIQEQAYDGFYLEI